eukprot:TRINITY_DN9390_c0_g1_i1.p1 TRINITY_DN9390_c0_g1~~TRINITY_DN9390_c0_g1_i1.p1  ORF type:complete len:375 (+),score=64.94 TRINITY_DN9390_c0_g1_i1:160-1284(+)
MGFPMTPQLNWTSNGMATTNMSDVGSVSSTNTVNSNIDQLKVKMHDLNHKLSDVDFQLYEIERAEQRQKNSPGSPALDHILQTVTDQRNQVPQMPVSMSKAATYEPLRPIRPLSQRDKASILSHRASHSMRAASVDSDVPFPFDDDHDNKRILVGGESPSNSLNLRRIPRQVSVETPRIPPHRDMQPIRNSEISSARSRGSVPRREEELVVVDDPPVMGVAVDNIHEDAPLRPSPSPAASINKMFGAASSENSPTGRGGSLKAFLRENDYDEFRKSPTPPSGSKRHIRSSRTPLEELIETTNTQHTLGDETALHLQQLRQQQIIVRQHAVADKQWRHQRRLEDVIQRQDSQIRLLQEKQQATELELQNLRQRLR